MENSKKITGKIFIFGITFFSLLACFNKGNDIKNSNLLYFDKTGKLVFTPHNSTHIIHVIDDNLIKDLEEVLDETTFDLLYDFKEDSLKINNIYYKHNPITTYYKDKYNIYFLTDTILVNMGKNSEYKILGGAYLKLNNKIFWNAKEIKNVDIRTFHTINIFREKSEWLKTVGLDKNYIYNGNVVMNETMFEKLYWNNTDSLRKQYFPR